MFICHDYVQLIALSHVLPDFLTEHSKVSENCSRLTPIQGGNLLVSKTLLSCVNVLMSISCFINVFSPKVNLDLHVMWSCG